ncbi:MAG: alpha/beta fold hydrolase [Sneathiella sp.]
MELEVLESKPVNITTNDGWTLKVNQFSPPDPGTKPKTILIIFPAMGAHARPYRFMASALAKMGNIVLTADPRGHGASLPHPKRGIDYGYDEILQQDMPAILAKVKEDHPALPIFLLGHSLGGHLVSAFAAENKNAVSGVITLTSTELHYKNIGHYSLLVYSVFALLAKLFGYLPGQHLGWGSPIAHRQVMDWVKWGFGGIFCGSDGRNLELLLKKTPTPNLCIGFTDDKRLATPKGVSAFAKKLPEDKTTYWSLSPEELGARTLSHFDHLRTGPKLWPRINDWISDQLSD